ncbi:alpha-mannosidase 2C1-like [Penaeus japonicus]|uniref:alpha-mannosidase 2C1-like n=1 Tax=Penaeus japonicus TaxID=27405 RepID=UPI001C70CBE4|nr:alpha-mannosidase 2C1-like [Penaeus japonicus]
MAYSPIQAWVQVYVHVESSWGCFMNLPGFHTALKTGLGPACRDANIPIAGARRHPAIRILHDRRLWPAPVAIGINYLRRKIQYPSPLLRDEAERNIAAITPPGRKTYFTDGSVDPITHTAGAGFAARGMPHHQTLSLPSGASQLADRHFAKGNGARAHTLSAVGNCHIDSAWLWPYSETKRKVGRSYSSQVKLMEDYPELVFVASQAQQWAWCKQYYPELFERVKEQVQAGRFLPVGGTWVEMDGNIPSGESFVRQFLHGQRFYQQELGVTCKEFWLPDTFGYSAQIPALMRHMGLSRFLTQKLSWNTVNKFPHHNFTWEGIDGSTVLAHFPPGDSYNMNCTVEEAVRTVRNLEDKGRVSTSAFLFGYGDGGGGPTQDMLERARRLKDADGCPRMNIVAPDMLFTTLENEQHNMCRWVGELYLELHNGTYTSQADMKRLCRSAEFSLRDAEVLLSSACATLGSAASALLEASLESLDVAWKKVLLNQFHDVLPGSGIGIIYPEATRYYEEAIAAATEVWHRAADALFGSGGEQTWTVFNTLQWEREEVVEALTRPDDEGGRSVGHVLVKAPPLGYAVLQEVNPAKPVSLTETDGLFVLDNGLLRAEINSYGQVVSLVTAGDYRDVFRKEDGSQLAGNQLVLFDDEPLVHDAWDVMDYHLETPVVLNKERSGHAVSPVTVVESSPLLVRLRWSVDISSDSTLTQDIELRASTPYLVASSVVDWHEDRKILKVVFEHNVLARNATFDIQFGHLERATHLNTSWDSARYEVCGHKWADVSEPDWGFAVLNDSKYGWMARGNYLSLSLLKAPKSPDDTCDMGSHEFKYALMPHVGTVNQAGIVQRAYEFNNPLRLLQLPSSTTSAQPTWSAMTVEGEGAVLHTIKPAEDGSGQVIVRLYECHGKKSKVNLHTSLPVTDATYCDGMEVEGAQAPFSTEGNDTTIRLSFTPFAIMALRLSF